MEVLHVHLKNKNKKTKTPHYPVFFLLYILSQWHSTAFRLPGCRHLSLALLLQMLYLIDWWFFFSFTCLTSAHEWISDFPILTLKVPPHEKLPLITNVCLTCYWTGLTWGKGLSPPSSFVSSFLLSCAVKQFAKSHLCDVTKGTCAVTNVYPRLEATRCSESHLMAALFVSILAGNFSYIIHHAVLLYWELGWKVHIEFGTFK